MKLCSSDNENTTATRDSNYNTASHEILISKALIDSYISHGKLVSINNVFRECNEMKEEIKNPETSVE